MIKRAICEHYKIVLTVASTTEKSATLLNKVTNQRYLKNVA